MKNVCKHLKTGLHLQRFETKSAARKHAKRTRTKFRKLVPYKCRHCNYWHVRTKANDEYYKVCKCRDHKRRLKRAYLDFTEVEMTRDSINREYGGNVRIYECPEYYDVWHLTGQRES